VWFTGLSASGKSTIAQQLERLLYDNGCSTYVFDGDNVGMDSAATLGFLLKTALRTSVVLGNGEAIC